MVHSQLFIMLQYLPNVLNLGKLFLGGLNEEKKNIEEKNDR